MLCQRSWSWKGCRYPKWGTWILSTDNFRMLKYIPMILLMNLRIFFKQPDVLLLPDQHIWQGLLLCLKDHFPCPYCCLTNRFQSSSIWKVLCIKFGSLSSSSYILMGMDTFCRYYHITIQEIEMVLLSHCSSSQRAS